MGIKGWWDSVLGDFKKSPFVQIDQLKGLRIGIDLSILLNKFSSSDVDKLAMTALPLYPAPDLFNSLKELHRQFSEVFVPIYVFDGKPPPIKAACRARRKGIRMRAGEAWIELRDRALQLEPDAPPFTDVELEEATKGRKAMKHPTAMDHANFLRWLIQEGVECYGSIYEANQQLIRLEADGEIDAIMSEDGDEIALGAK